MRADLTRRQVVTGVSVLGVSLAFSRFSMASAADGMSALPRTRALYDAGVAQGIHKGAQFAVMLDGVLVADAGLGWARDRVPMTPGTLMIWYSAGKPITAAGIVKLWDDGVLSLDDPVARFIPEFGQNGKDKVTIRHLLTHTAGFPSALRGPLLQFGGLNERVIKRLSEAELEWAPGRFSKYHRGAAHYVMAEIIQRASGKPFTDYVRGEILLPLGMDDCWIGMPVDRFEAYGGRIGLMHTQNADGALRAGRNRERWTLNPVPGGGARGPMHQFVRFYEALRRGGELEGARILSPQATEAFIGYRALVPGVDSDQPFQAPAGLGFQRDENPRFGRYASSRVFGHGGSRSSQAFCDPEYGLVVAYVFNGRPHNTRDHVQRTTAVAEAIYEDLGLVSVSA